MVISLKQIGTQAGRRLALLASREPFFFIIAVCTIALSFFSRPHVSAVHWDVIATLFSLSTPVASLASVISYKLYVRRYPSGGRYLKVFSAVNFSVLLLTLAALWALGRFAPGW